jgi:hypothetical protein
LGKAEQIILCVAFLFKGITLNKKMRLDYESLRLPETSIFKWNGYRPPFPFNGLWLYSHDNPLIHIAEQPFSAFGNGSIAHVALEGANYNALLKRLDNSAYSYTEKTLPISNERQLFITGPDGLTVEMLFPLDELLELTEKKQTLVYETNENFNFLGGKIL